MKIGEIDISKVMVGSDEIAAIYAGLDLVYSGGSTPPTPPTPTDYSKQYFTLVPKVTSTSFKFSGNTVSYSLDSGSTWTSLPSDTSTPSVGVGDKIMFKANLSQNSGSIGIFSSSSEFDADGNIMSLLYGDDFSGQTSLSGNSSAFLGLFSSSSVVSAENLVLPATTLANYCYHNMFQGCTSLTIAPQLQATALAEGCYYQMFSGCTSLTNAPQLPATTLASYCYYGMFYGCTSLTEAPQLPSTTLATQCYRSMFQGCTSLTVAPQLPATILANYCYQEMFRGCTSLTEAPILSATTLVGYCYNTMFYGCSSLNNITCLATNISALRCTTNWASNVASSGTFYKASGMTSWDSGGSGIPNNWTVLDYSE